uniref:DUF4371 domain-containing protein n=1 Tax=Panagrolaimus davidi TaxID=227884 RepID=A0A914Q159_9BILA
MNRQVIKPMVQSMLYLARNGMAFRGGNSVGFYDMKDSGDIQKQRGNFQTLLEARCQWGDAVLKSHLSSKEFFLNYTSWKVQNDLLNCARNIIRRKIVEEVHAAKVFTILADETQDISRKEQLCVAVRYLKDGEVVERFLGMKPLLSQTAVDIKNGIFKILLESGIDLKQAIMVCQVYDGASSMSGCNGGVQRLIIDIYATAFYVHCTAHTLNLAICKASKVRFILSTLTTINNVSVFIRASTQRCERLKIAIEAYKLSNKNTLIKLCETRWSEKVNSIDNFLDLLLAIIVVLDELRLENGDVAAKAQGYFNQITDEQFIYTLVLLSRSYDKFDIVCKSFQKIDTGIVSSMQLIKYLLRNIENWLSGNGVGSYQIISNKVKEIEKELSEKAEIQLTKPQGRQRRVDFKSQIYEPFLKEFKQQVEGYFGNHFELFSKFEAVLPGSDKEFANIKPLFEFYIKHAVIECSIDSIESEFEMWKDITKDTKRDILITKLLKIAQDHQLHAIASLLKILATIGGSSATAERCFSALKLIKTELRNATDDERLDSLISIYFNSKVGCSETEVITEYGKSKHRYNFA